MRINKEGQQSAANKTNRSGKSLHLKQSGSSVNTTRVNLLQVGLKLLPVCPTPPLNFGCEYLQRQTLCCREESFCINNLSNVTAQRGVFFVILKPPSLCVCVHIWTLFIFNIVVNSNG